MLYATIPIFAVVATMVGSNTPGLHTANNVIKWISASPVGASIDSVSGTIMTTSLQQMESIMLNQINKNCASQSPDLNVIARCQENGHEIIACLIETGGDLESCFERIKQQTCSQYSGNQRQPCYDQFDSLLGKT